MRDVLVKHMPYSNDNGDDDVFSIAANYCVRLDQRHV